MDPDKVLAEILELVAEQIVKCQPSGWAEKVEALHVWMSVGGYRPKAWAGKGVDLSKVPEPAMTEELDKLRNLLGAYKHPVLVAQQPQVVLASDVINGRDEIVVACLASHWAESSNPIEAVRLLHDSLKLQLENQGCS